MGQSSGLTTSESSMCVPLCPLHKTVIGSSLMAAANSDNMGKYDNTQ